MISRLSSCCSTSNGRSCPSCARYAIFRDSGGFNHTRMPTLRNALVYALHVDDSMRTIDCVNACTTKDITFLSTIRITNVVNDKASERGKDWVNHRGKKEVKCVLHRTLHDDIIGLSHNYSHSNQHMM